MVQPVLLLQALAGKWLFGGERFFRQMLECRRRVARGIRHDVYNPRPYWVWHNLWQRMAMLYCSPVQFCGSPHAGDSECKSSQRIHALNVRIALVESDYASWILWARCGLVGALWRALLR